MQVCCAALAERQRRPSSINVLSFAVASGLPYVYYPHGTLPTHRPDLTRWKAARVPPRLEWRQRRETTRQHVSDTREPSQTSPRPFGRRNACAALPTRASLADPDIARPGLDLPTRGRTPLPSYSEVTVPMDRQPYRRNLGSTVQLCARSHSLSQP